MSKSYSMELGMKRYPINNAADIAIVTAAVTRFLTNDQRDHRILQADLDKNITDARNECAAGERCVSVQVNVEKPYGFMDMIQETVHYFDIKEHKPPARTSAGRLRGEVLEVHNHVNHIINELKSAEHTAEHLVYTDDGAALTLSEREELQRSLRDMGKAIAKCNRVFNILDEEVNGK